MYDISCVGILTADIMAKPVEALPPKGLLSKIDSITMSLGGCAANVAIDLAKLGSKVQIFGKVGNDSFGEFAESEIKKAGVEAEGLCKSTTSQTSSSVVTISNDGERSILHCVGANGDFKTEDIDFEKLKDSKILFIAGTFLMPAFDGLSAARLLEKAKRNGVLCCLDTAWDASGQWMKKLGVCLPFLDWFMPSYEEAVELSKKTKPEEIAQTFRQMGADNVIIKLGSEGCYVLPADEEGFFVPAYKNDNVVDTSGAGDSFCAGFVHGLAQGWDIRTCARFANAVGCFCVGALGTTAGIESQEKILEFIQARS